MSEPWRANRAAWIGDPRTDERGYGNGAARCEQDARRKFHGEFTVGSYGLHIWGAR
jgi:hypothetical protein